MRGDVKRVMGIVVKRGLRVERTFLSADEHCEDVLHRLGIIDDDGFVIGELPLTEEDARNRVKQAVHD